MRKKIIHIAILVFLLLVSTEAKVIASTSKIRIAKTTCMLRSGTVVLDGDEKPYVGWQLEADYNGARQTAYEIEGKSIITGGIIFTTGKINSECTQKIFLEQSKINPGVPFSWRVRIWDENGNTSDWSSPDTIFIQSADDAFGDARWIGAVSQKDANIPEGRNFTGETLKKPEVKEAWAKADSMSRRSIYLSKRFDERKKNIVAAFVNICGLGFNELKINGRAVSDAVMTPLWSDYDKSVFYNTYDVTSLISKGSNEIEVLLGNGFYNVQGERYKKMLVSFGPPTLRFALTIYLKDKRGNISQERIVSDSSWKYALSPITFNTIYGGEDYDARMEQPDRWHPVVIQESPKGKLRPQIARPVKIMESFGVKSVDRNRKDTLVFDMGQNLAGFPKIKVKGQRGQQVKIWVGETLKDNGLVNQKQTGSKHYYLYTLKGGGEEEIWHPRFSYYSFRYIEIDGAGYDPTGKGDDDSRQMPLITDVQSCFIYNSAPDISSFECSNERINKTHRLINRAVRSNMQSVFTDCPAREKLGWLEQDYLNGQGLIMNYDLAPFLQQTMQNISDAQWDNGGMPTTAPEYVIFKGKWLDPFRESPEWGGAVVYLPILYYKYYGDDYLIKKYYDNMCRYVDYLSTKAENDILDFGLGDWYDYGPGRAGFSKNTPTSLVATAHYYYWTTLVALASRVIGDTEKDGHYTSLADKIRDSFNNKFYHADTHQYGTGSQTSNAIALMMGMNKKNDRDSVIANLKKDILDHGCRLTTGDIGNHFLFKALDRFGENELLYKMLDHDDVPGYGFQIRQGATTLTEQWDPRQGASQNHFMMGHIDELFFTSLAGIDPRGSEIEFHPDIVGDLKWVKASTEGAYGKICAKWEKDDSGDVIYNVQVPVGTKLSIHAPKGYKLYDGDNEKDILSASGNYEFRFVKDK